MDIINESIFLGGFDKEKLFKNTIILTSKDLLPWRNDPIDIYSFKMDREDRNKATLIVYIDDTGKVDILKSRYTNPNESKNLFIDLDTYSNDIEMMKQKLYHAFKIPAKYFK